MKRLLAWLCLISPAAAHADRRHVFVAEQAYSKMELLWHEMGAGASVATITAPCGQPFAVAAEEFAAVGYALCADGSLISIDADARTATWHDNRLGHPTALVVSPSSNYLFVAGLENGKLQQISLPIGNRASVFREWTLPDSVATHLAITPDGERLAGITNSGILFVIDPFVQPVDLRVVAELDTAASGLALSADGAFAYVSGQDSKLFYLADVARLESDPTYSPQTLPLTQPSWYQPALGEFAENPDHPGEFWIVYPGRAAVVFQPWAGFPTPVSFLVVQPRGLAVDSHTPMMLVVENYGDSLVPFHFNAGVQPRIQLAGDDPVDVAIGGVVHPLRASISTARLTWTARGQTVRNDVVITNTSKLTIKVNGAGSGGNAVFAASGCQGTLGPGGKCTLTVACTPPKTSTETSFRARLLLNNDSAQGSKPIGVVCEPRY